MADEITPENIVDAALSPQSATVDGNSATARPIAEIIEADRYTSGKQAVGQRTNRGIRFNKIVPPGGGT